MSRMRRVRGRTRGWMVLLVSWLSYSGVASGAGGDHGQLSIFEEAKPFLRDCSVRRVGGVRGLGIVADVGIANGTVIARVPARVLVAEDPRLRELSEADPIGALAATLTILESEIDGRGSSGAGGRGDVDARCRSPPAGSRQEADRVSAARARAPRSDFPCSPLVAAPIVAAWVRALPSNASTLAFFDDDECEELRGTILDGSCIDARAALRAHVARLAPSVEGLGADPARLPRALGLAHSRAFAVPPRPARSTAGDGDARASPSIGDVAGHGMRGVFAPVLDLFNSRTASDASYRYERTAEDPQGAFVVRAVRDIAPGEEIFVTYRHASAADTITQYGYAEEVDEPSILNAVIVSLRPPVQDGDSDGGDGRAGGRTPSAFDLSEHDLILGHLKVDDALIGLGLVAGVDAHPFQISHLFPVPAVLASTSRMLTLNAEERHRVSVAKSPMLRMPAEAMYPSPDRDGVSAVSDAVRAIFMARPARNALAAIDLISDTLIARLSHYSTSLRDDRRLLLDTFHSLPARSAILLRISEKEIIHHALQVCKDLRREVVGASEAVKTEL